MCGEHEHDVFLQLVETLKDDSDSYAAIDDARVLGTLGKHSVDAVNELSLYIVDGMKFRVREACARALGSLGKNAESAAVILARLLNDGHWDLRDAAVEAIGSLGKHASTAIPRIRKFLNNGDMWAKVAAAQALGALGENATSEISLLAQSLNDSWPEVRKAAVTALGEMAKHTGSALPILTTALTDKDSCVRAASLEALAAIRNIDAPVAKQIVPFLKDKDLNVQKAAVKAIVNLGEHASVWIPMIQVGLSHERQDVRLRSAETLGGLGKFAASAVEELTKSLKSQPSELDRQAAAEALGLIISDRSLGALEKCEASAIKALSEALQFSEDTDDINLCVREAVVRALGRLGEHAASEAKVLAKALNSGNTEVRQEAVKAITLLENMHSRQFHKWSVW